MVTQGLSIQSARILALESFMADCSTFNEGTINRREGLWVDRPIHDLKVWLEAA